MSTIGIIGGGQLGQMLGFAAEQLGVGTVFLDPGDDPPAAAAGRVLRLAFDDPEGLRQLAADSELITYEFENVPTNALEALPPSCRVYPPAMALQVSQDRLLEKRLFRELDIQTPEFHNVESRSALGRAAADLGYPFVLKTRRLGYDGKGQLVVRAVAELDQAWRSLGDVPLIAEAWVPFDFEVSAIGGRNPSGDIAHYPLTENRHDQGILRTSIAPAEHGSLRQRAIDFHERLLTHLDYVGVLALELFVVGDRLLANEIAPRVHNSGHWTIEGTAGSQFENHLRAVLDMPLADTAATGHAGMVNLIGRLPEELEKVRNLGFYVHDYGKEPRPGRKLGHATIVCADPEERDLKLAAIRQYLPT